MGMDIEQTIYFINIWKKKQKLSFLKNTQQIFFNQTEKAGCKIQLNIVEIKRECIIEQISDPFTLKYW